MLPSIEEASKGSGPASYIGRITVPQMILAVLELICKQSLHAVGQLAGVVPTSTLTDRLIPHVSSTGKLVTAAELSLDRDPARQR